MLACSLAVAVVGVRGHLVEVEADLAQGLPGLTLVGLPDAALSEARDRVRAAVVNSGCAWPQRRLTVNLSPAALPKSGAGFDLALAVAVLAAAGEDLPADALHGRVLLGELGLDGRLRGVPGVLPAALAAADAGARELVVPAENEAEAALVPGLAVVGRTSLAAVLRHLRREPALDGDCALPPAAAPQSPAASVLDLADVAGQAEARRAVEVAAAGGHHLLLAGAPGVGKTMLAERLPGLLPDLDRAAALEVTAVHSVAQRLPAGVPLLTRPPFQAPHSTVPPRPPWWAGARPGCARARPAWRTAGCSSSTRRRSSPRSRSTPCARASSPGASSSSARRPAPSGRPGSSWCSPRTRARAATPAGAASHLLHLPAAGGASLRLAGSPARCWTGSTSG